MDTFSSRHGDFANSLAILLHDIHGPMQSATRSPLVIVVTGVPVWMPSGMIEAMDSQRVHGRWLSIASNNPLSSMTFPPVLREFGETLPT